MKSFLRKRLSLTVGLLLLLISTIALSNSVFGAGMFNNKTDFLGKISPDFLTELSTSGSPYFNNSADLRFRVTPLLDAPNTTVEIILPKGVT